METCLLMRMTVGTVGPVDPMFVKEARGVLSSTKTRIHLYCPEVLEKIKLKNPHEDRLYVRKCDFFHLSRLIGTQKCKYCNQPSSVQSLQIPQMGGSSRHQAESNGGVETPPVPVSLNYQPN